MTRRSSPFAFPKPSSTSAFHMAKKSRAKEAEITESDVVDLITDAEAKHSGKTDAIPIDDDQPIQFLASSADAPGKAASSHAPAAEDKRPPIYN